MSELPQIAFEDRRIHRNSFASVCIVSSLRRSTVRYEARPRPVPSSSQRVHCSVHDTVSQLYVRGSGDLGLHRHDPHRATRTIDEQSQTIRGQFRDAIRTAEMIEMTAEDVKQPPPEKWFGSPSR